MKILLLAALISTFGAVSPVAMPACFDETGWAPSCQTMDCCTTVFAPHSQETAVNPFLPALIFPASPIIFYSPYVFQNFKNVSSLLSGVLLWIIQKTSLP